MPPYMNFNAYETSMLMNFKCLLNNRINCSLNDKNKNKKGLNSVCFVTFV